ncbi:MAG: formyltransferase family protein [bacterium]
MRIFILAMDDPLYTNQFIKDIIKARKKDIIGFAHVTKGNRLTVGKNRSKTEYLLSLLLIMGGFHFCKNSLNTISHKIKVKMNELLNNRLTPTVYDYCIKEGIEAYKIKSPNSKQFLELLKSKQPDVIINQSQCIIKKKLLAIPKIGVINRHNALLPKNRGRLTPFWVLYKQEKETGVSIHFVEESLDSGDIIVQKQFDVSKKDTFNTIVNKNYKLAIVAMLEALDKLEKDITDYIQNDDNKSTYNSSPSFRNALEYRFARIKRLI